MDGTLAGQDPRPGSEPRILEVVQNLAGQSEMHGWGVCVCARACIVSAEPSPAQHCVPLALHSNLQMGAVRTPALQKRLMFREAK